MTFDGMTMPSGSAHLAVVPAYNESATIAGVIDAIRQAQPDFDVLVVDDGSLDATLEVAQAAGAQIVRHPFNLGIGGAVQSGFLFALEHGYDYLVQVDGDGQHDPARSSGCWKPWPTTDRRRGVRLALPGPDMTVPVAA